MSLDQASPASIEFIQVDEGKLESMIKHVWTELERPLVACPLEFRSKDRDSWSSGYLMFTRGAIYVFKSKIVGKMELSDKYHLLDIRDLVLRPDLMKMQFDDSMVSFKTDAVASIAHAMLYVLKEATFGLKMISPMNVDSTIHMPEVVVLRRPPNALKWRALFLAHFYDIKGQQLYTMDYFEKWEARKDPMILLGPSLHPGNFAAAFGHAVAWESIIEVVCFQNFAPTKFPKLLDSLVENAWSIKRIAFTELVGSRLPTFSGNRITRSSVTQYLFGNVLGSVLVNFLENTMKYPQIEELMITKLQASAEEFSRAVDLIVDTANTAVHGKLKKLYLMETKITQFPTASISKLLKGVPSLRSISLKGLNGDGDRMLRACLRAGTTIKLIAVGGMPFRSVLDQDVRIPPLLQRLDLSNSTFTPESLAGIFKLLTSRPLKYPVSICLRHSGGKAETLKAFELLNLSECQPNILEFDYGANRIDIEAGRHMFAFLFTQRRMRLLTLRDMRTSEPVQFLTFIMRLIPALRLPGLDLSGDFDPVMFTQFLQALGQNGQSASLRRLDVSRSKAGIGAMGALNELIKASPGLSEVCADGFNPENPHAIYALWATISQHPSICACDLPEKDLARVGIPIPKSPPEFQAVYEVLSQKPRPSTPVQRDDFSIDLIEQGVSPPDSGDIFKLSGTMQWAEDAEFDDE